MRVNIYFACAKYLLTTPKPAGNLADMTSTAEISWWREPTKGQWMTFAAAWVGWILDAFDFTIFLLVMPRIQDEFHVDATATAGSITITLLLRLCGGSLAGAAADRWGRKLPLMISMVWFAACDSAIAFAPSFAWVLALRALFGFGMGAEWTSGATLAMENWPSRSRGIASGILQGSWAVGYFLAAIVSAYVVPHWGWRGLFIVAAAPALFVLPIRIFVPESGDWKNAAAERVPLRRLATPALLARVAWASLVMALGFAAYYALTALYPTMLTREFHLGTGEVASLVAYFNIGMLVGAAGCGFFAARHGVVRAVAVPAVVAVPLLPLYVGTASSLLGPGAFLLGIFGAGFCGIVPLFLTNLFQPPIRARAVGVVYHVGACLASIAPTAVAALSKHSHLPLSRAIVLVGGSCLLALAATLYLGGAPREVAVGPSVATS
jgi:SHS family lactate transporter-like MFS transporter